MLLHLCVLTRRCKNCPRTSPATAPSAAPTTSLQPSLVNYQDQGVHRSHDHIIHADAHAHEKTELPQRSDGTKHIGKERGRSCRGRCENSSSSFTVHLPQPSSKSHVTRAMCLGVTPHVVQDKDIICTYSQHDEERQEIDGDHLVVANTQAINSIRKRK